MDALRATALTLIIIGAVNWGLIGLFNFDLVDAIFGGNTQYAPSLAPRIVMSSSPCRVVCADVLPFGRRRGRAKERSS